MTGFRIDAKIRLKVVNAEKFLDHVQRVENNVPCEDGWRGMDSYRQAIDLLKQVEGIYMMTCNQGIVPLPRNVEIPCGNLEMMTLDVMEKPNRELIMNGGMSSLLSWRSPHLRVGYKGRSYEAGFGDLEQSNPREEFWVSEHPV